MTEIFVSYASENRDRVETLVEAFRSEGLNVWWDVDIPVQAEWSQEIEKALLSAKAVVVCWTPDAVDSENVREEARRARKKGLLLQCFLEPCEPPLFFGELQGADLSKWEGDRDHKRFRMLVEGLRALVAGKRPSRALSKIVGYKSQKSSRAPIALGSLAVLAASAVGLLAISDIRDLIIPQQKMHWTLNPGNSIDLRPGEPLSRGFAVQQGARMMIVATPQFSPQREFRSRAAIETVTATLELPGSPSIEFSSLYHSDVVAGGQDNYLGRIESATPFELEGALSREMVFEPNSLFSWGDFIEALNRLLSEDISTFSVTIQARFANPEQHTVSVLRFCQLPVAPVLENIQTNGVTPVPVVAPCEVMDLILESEG